MKKCPYCAEDIQDEAVFCKHCKSNLSKSLTQKIESHTDKKDVSLKKVNKKTKWTNWLFGGPIFLVTLLFLLYLIRPAFNNNNPAESSAFNQEVASIKSWHEVKIFDGKGNQDTSSFYVSGDRVKITAITCCGSPSIGTYSAISLESDGGGYLGPGLSISTNGAEKGQAETIYRNLRTGDYYIQVISGVGWKVIVEEYR